MEIICEQTRTTSCGKLIHMTTEDFIKKSEVIHNNFYDYSLVEFINSTTKVKIICPIHGVFEQEPRSHLNKNGCKKCSYVKKQITLNEFIERAQITHNNKYDYSLVELNGSKAKVKIICPIHGVFEQEPREHLRGRGCSKCSPNKIAKSKTLTSYEFIERAQITHNNKYDYSLTNYQGMKSKVKIICPIHGAFEQTPLVHLSGSGCRKCGTEILKSKLTKTTDWFIQESEKIHGKLFDYSKTVYTRYDDKVLITCKVHGDFLQSVKHHLNGSGCPKCNASKGELLVKDVLIKKNIFFEEQKKLIKNETLSFDFYIPNINLCIEFQGRQHYEAVDIFGGKEALRKQVLNDEKKRKFCKENNIKLIEIPYYEIDNIDSILEVICE